ncbi:ABC-2 type transport system permease protein [Actinomadura pelletieri DSM 43383]|uniref:Transport permease protein n=1 Tax=Actinomadura pelletieri DSM 43383 TaxID=1120940 RepID=A0A495QSX0_9ACTN|nr:ABC transporter permease [Actinomadura pelletieri]RKS76599.1 ABC-2 type transport system permease protein [Actinomadura pelletieri DSM 43383]
MNAASMGAATWTIALRGIRRTLRTPQIIVMGLLQSVAFLLIFRYVFGGAIDTRGTGYVDYMIPGLLTVSGLFAGMSAAVAVADDVASGYLDRLRSLPMPRTAVVAGQVLADTVRVALILAVSAALAFAVGFRVHNGWGHALAAFGLCVLFGFAFVWTFVALGLLTGDPQAAQGVGFLALPLSFVSSAYVPVETMPGPLRAFAENQPVTVMMDAVRGLTQDAGPYTGDLTRALAWTAGIIAVSAIVAVGRVRRT